MKTRCRKCGEYFGRLLHLAYMSERGEIQPANVDVCVNGNDHDFTEGLTAVEIVRLLEKRDLRDLLKKTSRKG